MTEKPSVYRFDPDFRRGPRDNAKPFCCTCQQNVNPKDGRAVPVTVNWESWTLAFGHTPEAAEAVRNDRTSNKVIGQEWIGPECKRKLELVSHV